MSTVRRDLRHGFGIARVEGRRHVRKSTATRKQRLTLVGALVVFTPVLYLWFGIAHEAGLDAARTGSFPVDRLGLQLFLLVVVFVVMAAMRVVQEGRPEGEALLLTTVSTRAVLLGRLVDSTIQLVGFVLLPTVLFAGAFALGAGEPLVVATAVLAIVPLFTAVNLLGTVVGQLFLLGLLQSRRLRRVSQAFGVVLLLALMALSYVIVAPATGASTPLGDVTAVARPFAAYLAFVFLGSGLVAPPDTVSLVVGGLLVASLPVLAAVADRLAPRLWFADASPTDLLARDASRPTGDEVAPGTAATASRRERYPPMASTPTLGVALGLWTRWLRIPARFTSLFPLVVMFATAVLGVVDDPNLLPLAGGAVLVFGGVYVSGAMFGLNPLGDAGDMRTVEALAARPSRVVVRGHVVAGLLVGLPAVAMGVAMLALAGDVPVPTAIVGGLLAVVLTIASAGVAVGLGTTLPSLDSRRTYRGYEVATPSLWVLLGYTFAVVLLVGVASLVAALLVVPTGVDPSPALTVGAPAVVAGVLLAVGYGGYRQAVRRLDAPVFV